jgi:hypothetical protein
MVTPSPSLPPVPPTPTLRPAISYVDGHTPILQGMYFFIEYFVVNDGTSSASECPGAAMIDFPGYSFSQGILTTGPMSLADLTPALGFLGFGQANTGAMGGGVSSNLEVISGLPFSLPYDVATIHALDATGEIVAEIQGSSYLLAPGESWVQAYESDPTEDCHRTTTARLTNHGLVDESQIRP